MHKDMDVYARVHVCVHVGMLTCMYVLYACTQGRTALHLAAANGHVDTVDVLLSLGAGDTRARSLDRYIHVACACACVRVRVCVCVFARCDVYARMDSRAEMGATDKHNKTPLMLAACNNEYDTVLALERR